MNTKNTQDTQTSNNPCGTPRRMSGSQAIIESFLAEGAETIFGYPGGAVIPIYDALYDYRDRIDHILVRHEQAAVHAAEGYARATGRVGVCMVTSGPGATNTVTGLADALLDSTPVVLISGQVASSLLGTDAFQETNFIGITQAVTKWNCQVKRAQDIPEAIAKAFYIARSGRPGPVVVDITKDAQVGMMDFCYKKVEHIRSYVPSPAPDREQVAEAARLINLSRRPMALVGQGVILGDAEKELLAFLEKSGMPAAATLLGLSALPSDHPQNVGMLGDARQLRAEHQEQGLRPVGSHRNAFRRPRDGRSGQVRDGGQDHPPGDRPLGGEQDHLCRRAVVGDVKQTLPMLTEMVSAQDHSAWIAEFRACDKVEEQKIITPALHPASGRIRMGEAVRKVSDAAPKDTIMVTDVGQHQMFAARYCRYTTPRTLITSGGLGTMGYGLPAAVGAKLGCPDRQVVLFVGDGGLQMNIQELATIMQSHVGVKIVLLNNNYLGMVRQWQELFYNRRYSFTDMLSPEYSLIARANEVGYELVEKREDLDGAIARMLESPEAFLLEVRVEKEDDVFPMVPAGAAVSDIMLE